MEILRDFNGWSWDKTYSKKFNYLDNLIYQNLLMILGDDFLSDWRTSHINKKDFLYETQKYIRFFTGNDEYIKSIYKVLYLKNGKKEKIDKLLKANKIMLKKMDDKIFFIEKAKSKKEKLNKRLDKIELILSDYQMLEKEFIKYNSSLEKTKKITSVKKYKNLLLKEKEKKQNEVSEIDYILKPNNFLIKKQLLKNVVGIAEGESDFEKCLINCQMNFLYFIDKKLNKMKTRDEIVDVLYELRYYKTLKISRKINITDIDALNNRIDLIMKKAITKLCKLGAINIMSMDINLNFEIIKYAIDTKIIDLEKIKLYFEKEDENNLIIKVFDKEIIEKQGRKKIELTNKTLAVKEKRKIKLFN